MPLVPITRDPCVSAVVCSSLPRLSLRPIINVSARQIPRVAITFLDFAFELILLAVDHIERRHQKYREGKIKERWDKLTDDERLQSGHR
jgi:hypothetical protein